MNSTSKTFVRITAWSLVAGGFLAYATSGILVSATGWDPQTALQGTTMLSLPNESRDLFRLAMLADIFGFYLPILVFCGYFWRYHRIDAGAFGDAAILAMMFYVTVGIAGASIQQAVIYPLSQLYRAGDDTVRAAAATAWTTLAHAAQGGLWWCEGPAVFLWSMVVGNWLRKTGWKGALLLQISGLFCGIFFLSAFFSSLDVLAKASEMIAASLLPLWMVVFGWQLQRRSKPGADANASGNFPGAAQRRA